MNSNICYLFILIVFLLYCKERKKQSNVLDKKAENISKIEILGAVFCYSALMFVIARLNGVLSCGFHFMDDKETYTLGNDIQNMGFFNATLDCIKGDMGRRFRYLYWVIRMAEIKLFADNFTLWHMTMTLLTGINMSLCYVYARKRECPVWISCAVPIVIYGGSQFTVAFMLGPQENWGLFLLSFAMIFLVDYLKSRKKRYFVGLIIFTVLTAGIKESFILMLPVLILMAVNYEINYLGYNKESWIKNILASVKRNIVYIVITIIVFLLNMSILYFNTHSDYSNVDTMYDFTVNGYIMYLWQTFSGWLKHYMFLSIFGLILLVVPLGITLWKIDKKQFKEYCLKYSISIITLAFVFVTQLYLHKNTGMGFRYLIPTTIILTIFWFVDVYKIVESYKEAISEIVNTFYILWIYIFITVIVNSGVIYSYVYEGANTTKMLDDLAVVYDGRDIVSLIGGEANYSAAVYMQEKYGISNLYCIGENEYFYDGYAYEKYMTDESEIDKISGDQAYIYIARDNQMEIFCADAGLNINDFEIKEYGYFYMYIYKY